MSAQTILITGVNGFVGQHMAAELHAGGHRVIGIGLEKRPALGLQELLNDYAACDLTDQAAVDALKPLLENITGVVHLAGIATTNNTPEQAAAVMRINVDAHKTLYRTLDSIHSKARVIAVSTGLAYDQTQPVPFKETSALLPDNDTTNAYVRSKLQVEAVAETYRQKGLDIVTVRPFNHIGPHQGLGFFVPDKAAAIQQAKTDKTHLDFGDGLDFWRDFTDVRDVVRAYMLLVTAPTLSLHSRVYNSASTVPVFGRDLFRLLAKELDFSDYTLTDKPSAADTPRITGDASLLRQDTGWQPLIPLDKTIQDFVAALS